MADALSDCLLSFRLLNVGGVLVVDDLESYANVARAATAFIEALKGKQLEVLHQEVRKLSVLCMSSV